MNRALLLRNLHQFRRLLPALMLGCFALQLLIVHIAAAFGPAMFEMFEALPPYFRSFVGGQLMNDLSFTGFIAFGFQHPASLAMGLSLAISTATLPAAERESGLLDLLLARPLPRASYLRATLISLLIGVSLLPAAQLLGLMVGLATVSVEDKPAWTRFLPATCCMSALFLACGGVTLFFASSARRRGIASARAVGVLLVLYVIEAFASLYPPLANVSWLSPFHYFQPIVNAMQGLQWGDVLVLVAVFGVSTSAAFVRFEKLDL